MITSLLYVSRSTLQLPDEQGEVDDIVAVARSRNAKLGVTGALIFTKVNFAQVLEGTAEAVEELMRSIRADRRHQKLDVVNVLDVAERSFPGWNMAYAGPSTYVERHVDPLVSEQMSEERRRVMAERLRALMQEFAAG